MPFSNQSYYGADLLVWGITMHMPLHTVTLFSPLVSGTEQVGVKDQLPVAGVDLILGNEFAGGKMFPATPEAAENPAADVFGHAPSGAVSLQFSMCGCSCTDLGDAVDISHTFFKSLKLLSSLCLGIRMNLWHLLGYQTTCV